MTLFIYLVSYLYMLYVLQMLYIYVRIYIILLGVISLHLIYYILHTTTFEIKNLMFEMK